MFGSLNMPPKDTGACFTSGREDIKALPDLRKSPSTTGRWYEIMETPNGRYRLPFEP